MSVMPESSMAESGTEVAMEIETWLGSLEREALLLMVVCPDRSLSRGTTKGMLSRGGSLFFGDSLIPEGRLSIHGVSRDCLIGRAVSEGCLLRRAASEGCLLKRAASEGPLLGKGASEGKLDGDATLRGATLFNFDLKEVDSCIRCGTSKDTLLPNDGPLLASTETAAKVCVSTATTGALSIGAAFGVPACPSSAFGRLNEVCGEESADIPSVIAGLKADDEAAPCRAAAFCSESMTTTWLSGLTMPTAVATATAVW